MSRGGIWRTAAAIAGALVPATVVLAIPGSGIVDGTGLIPYVAGPVTGFVLVLVAFAAPLQRSGTSTVPAFAFARLDSRGARSTAAYSAAAVCLLLALPLVQISGSLLARTIGFPQAAGVLAVGAALALASAMSGSKGRVVGQAVALLVRAVALVAAFALLAAGTGSPLASSAFTSGTPTVTAAGLAGAASLFVALACGTAALPQVLDLVGGGAGGRGARAVAMRASALTALVLAGGAVAAALPGAPASTGPAAVLLLLGALAAGVAASFAAIGAVVPAVPARGRARGRAGIAAAGVSVALTAMVLLAGPVDLTPLLGWAFSLAAAALFPVMVLGSWYRGLTAIGVVAGVASAAASTAAAAVYSMIVAVGALPAPTGLVSALALQPALLTVPLSFAVMGLVSMATAAQVPVDVDARMLRMHAPEELGVAPAAGGEGADGR